LSSNQEFIIKINGIIGKTWLATLDDSGGYVLSLKTIEQNSSLSVSPQRKQEEKNTVIETNPQNIVVTKITKKKRWNEDSFTIEEIYDAFSSYFLGDSKQLRSFVEEFNLYTVNLGTSSIKYEELEISNNEKEKTPEKTESESNVNISTQQQEKIDNTTRAKIDRLIKFFVDKNELFVLYEFWRNYNHQKNL
jgi:hypothetical protein